MWESRLGGRVQVGVVKARAGGIWASWGRRGSHMSVLVVRCLESGSLEDVSRVMSVSFFFYVELEWFNKSSVVLFCVQQYYIFLNVCVICPSVYEMRFI